MKRGSLGLCLGLFLFLSVPASSETLPTLDFRQRVEAQLEIERLAWEYRLGKKEPFEKAVPRELVERKVADYLAQSRLLEQRWNRPITGAALRREMERIASGTRSPKRLRELYAALNHDSVLIHECIARPALVERLARGYHATDLRVQRSRTRGSRENPAENRPWDVWWADRRSGFSVAPLAPVLDVELPLPRPRSGTASGSEDYWDGAGLANSPPLLRLSYQAVRVWTGSEMLLWGWPGSGWPDPSIGQGYRYDPLTDRWSAIESDGAPEFRAAGQGVWTGSEMIVWGGRIGNDSTNTGGRYDPVSNRWQATSTVGAPSARDGHETVWTGSEMIVWGGGFLADGGRYDPSSDSWSSISTLNAPPGSSGAVSFWTGSEMIVWGGVGEPFDPYAPPALTSGGRYDPIGDSWRPMSTSGTGPGRIGTSAVWTGSEMLVWGGSDRSGGTLFGDGRRYDPSTDQWATMTSVGEPSPRSSAITVWAAGKMVVWGGSETSPAVSSVRSGARYDPAQDAWLPISFEGSPERSNRGLQQMAAVSTGDEMLFWNTNERWGARYDAASDRWGPVGTPFRPRRDATAVWTGNEMIVWGGVGPASFQLASGGRYDPTLDNWRPMPFSSSRRSEHTAVWTGSEMIVWGGRPPGAPPSTYRTGQRYDPVSNSWLSFVPAPSGSRLHSAVWTGSEMIVWGGVPAVAQSYDPVNDRWKLISAVGAPTDRVVHSALWTGSEMIVWGGLSGGVWQTQGARYSPLADTWSPIALSSAAPASSRGSAVWTGSEMLVWDRTPSNDLPGARYSPATNTWAGISAVGQPEARSSSRSVWTGSEMIVWGGSGTQGRRFNSGGRYDPVSDSWQPTTLVGAPAPRTNHSLVWTGEAMLVWGGHDGFSEINDGSAYRPPNANQPPVARCKAVIVEANDACEGAGTIDDGSFDPDGAEISIVLDPPGPYPLGETIVTLVVTDEQGSEDSCAASVTVEDVTDPDLEVGLSPTSLWPPNHKLVEIEATVSASDNCGSPSLALTSLSSNEVDDAIGAGDGQTIGDIQFGVDDLHFSLRAERSAQGVGRVYSVIYSATDAGGNSVSTTRFVTVPLRLSVNSRRPSVSSAIVRRDLSD